MIKVKIDTSDLASIKPELVELLKNLRVGDTLRGRVLEILNNSIAVKTPDGRIFTALLKGNADISKGAFIELIVSSIADGKVYAEFKGEGFSIESEVKINELLRQISLPVNKGNADAVKLLLKYNLPADRESILNIIGLKKSVDNLSRSSEARTGLLQSGLNINDTEVDILNKIALSLQEVPEGKANIDGSADYGISKETLIQEKSIIVEGGSREQEAVGNEGSKEIEVKGKGGSREPEAARAEANKELGVTADNDKADGIGRFSDRLTEIFSEIKDTDLETLTYLVSKNIAVTPKNLKMLIRNIKDSDEISQILNKLQNKMPALDNAELKIIRESIKKVFLEPGQAEDRENVTELLKNVAELGEKLEKFLIKSGDRSPELINALSDLKDNIDFIRSVNQYINYLQIPIMINGNNTTAKIYIFNKGKRNRTIDLEDATVVISLDPENLGHLESIIRVQNKNVNATFKVQNKKAGAIIEENAALLKGALEEKGYNLAPIKVMLLEEPFNLLSIEAGMGEYITDRIHFDVRV